MSALVRMFAHTSIVTAPVHPGSGRYSTDSVGILRQPYVARQSITATTGSAQTTSANLTANAAVKLLSVQIQPGKTVAIESLPPNRTGVEADADSPRYSGDVLIECGHGWQFSLMEIEVV